MPFKYNTFQKRATMGKTWLNKLIILSIKEKRPNKWFPKRKYCWFCQYKIVKKSMKLVFSLIIFIWKVCILYFNTRCHTKLFVSLLFLSLPLSLLQPVPPSQWSWNAPLNITRKSCWAAWARLNESLSGLPFSGQIHHFANKCECAWPKLNSSSSSSSCSNLCYVSFYLVNCRRSSSSSGRAGQGREAEVSRQMV